MMHDLRTRVQHEAVLQSFCPAARAFHRNIRKLQGNFQSQNQDLMHEPAGTTPLCT